jgi:CRISPR/Cas system endoribonuclease Cas6 (RAMP superfamily)
MRVEYPIKREVIRKIFEELKKREEAAKKVRNFKITYIEDETIRKLKRDIKQRTQPP